MAARRSPTPRAQLDAFLDRFLPDVARRARAALRTLRTICPGALELVYDNTNALAIGFSPTERASDVIVSIAVYPRYPSLFFLQDGVKLPDPTGRLRGAGNRVRHIVLDDRSVLDAPDVRKLLSIALSRARVPLDPKARRAIVIKSIAAKQRPRRPAEPVAKVSPARRRAPRG
ncbi:MAG TPA: hypothetical protein VGG39_33165 [Polyangiaceae bacterium]|jgi:hypothetical protein